MIKDLDLVDNDMDLAADVAVVGAGIAGLFLASTLARAGVHVVVVESGGREQKGEVHPLNDVIQLGQTYMGARHGRFRCLGGTSTRWGGALLPFLDEDLEDRAYLGLEAWPVGMKELRRFLPEVERIFAVDDGSYDVDILNRSGPAHVLRDRGDGDFIPRFAKWPAFERRNVAALFDDQIRNDSRLEIWLHAHVASVRLAPGRDRTAEIICRNQKGKKLHIEAKHYVLCAGAIETTRLMLQIDAEHSGVFSSSCDALGRYFHDHVSAATANIVSARPEMLNRLAGHRFVGRTMRSLRFELAPSAQRSDRVGAAFSHITFESRAPTGFDHLRLLLRGIQKRQGFAPRLMASLAGSVPYLARLAFWRYARGQLYWPRPAEYRLHTVVEQLPKRDNRIVLSDARDVFGQRMAAIDWRMDDAVLRTLEACRWRFERYWNSLQLDRVGRLEWSDEIGSLDALASRAGDIFHPGGTTRMGSSRSTALVDGQLRSFALSNLWISSTSTFPAGGGANPTLVLILFTMRLAERLQRELRA